MLYRKFLLIFEKSKKSGKIVCGYSFVSLCVYLTWINSYHALATSEHVCLYLCTCVYVCVFDCVFVSVIILLLSDSSLLSRDHWKLLTATSTINLDFISSSTYIYYMCVCVCVCNKFLFVPSIPNEFVMFYFVLN